MGWYDCSIGLITLGDPWDNALPMRLFWVALLYNGVVILLRLRRRRLTAGFR
jgi:hypothetical protein